ncbi:hypothetical protein J0X19_19750 [Hymenobacter sp. BT186]|uniref:Uncharacterized protein n=1 Tax=Hymenobacter telluris TaxID=2816474 RepID=A0A939JCH6_9BACT|nr:hypothetical protein [Hymenobacter telluris]MBO0360206.1 hypothetical protein [Hymenobacter telluris]MBW3376233.1 hypothetical protein [Hymenobacter norwichensis]
MEPDFTDTLSDNLERKPRATVGAQISMQEAIDWTKTYQADHKGQLKAVYFSADVFQTLLKQYGADGIRIYNATDDQGKDCFVLVGATATGDLTEGQALVYDKGQSCPDTCAVSPLNHS